MNAIVVIRVFTTGQPKFQLRKGEAGSSVFDPDAVAPPLTEPEILQSFRSGSQTVVRSVTDIELVGLMVISVLGDSRLPLRLQLSHCEIRPGPGMTRPQFKSALASLE